MAPERPLVGWRLDAAHVAVPIDLRLYSREAALRAAYKLTDRCFVLLERDSDAGHTIIAFLAGRSASADLGALALELRNELIDQQLRCTLEQQFNDVRTLIVAQAFSATNLLDPDADEGDFRGDPLGAGSNR